MSSTIDALNSIASTSTSSTSAATEELGQDAFLKLMIAQIQNQDPTDPSDPAEFLGQLAQFSTVSGIQNMQSSISTLTDSLRTSQVLDGTSLVGQDVMVAGDTVTLGETDSVTGAVAVPENATEVVLLVTDSSGALVRQMSLPTTEGTNEFTWDGTTNLGERAPAGTYNVSAIANVGGAAEELETQVAGHVNSVSIDPSDYSLTLNTNLGSLALADVRRVQ